MNMKTFRIFFLVGVSALLFSCNQNKTSRSNGSKMNESGMTISNKETGKDNDFVKDAASGGMMEVELGKYAEQNAMNPRVKNFGAMMVRDHTKANDELRSIATNKSIDLSQSGQNKNDREMSDLQKKTGKDFDKAYMKMMVDDHKKDIDEFRKQADNGNDPDLKSFASKCLPILQTHQDSAVSILNSLKY
jgi:putative membrane protein